MTRLSCSWRRLAPAFSALVLAAAIAPHGARAESSRPLGDTAVPLPERELLEYSIQFGVIKAGRATMTIGPADSTSGDSLVELISRAESSSFFSKFYPVDDVVRSIVDENTFLPVRFEKRLSEGSYHAYESFRFDREASRAIYSSGDTVAVPVRARDVLSAFHDVRRHALAPGMSLTFPNHSNKKTSIIEIKVLGNETIDTRVGRFRCIKVQPVMAHGGLFKNEGRIWVWFTDDDKRIPVRMESKLAFGAITVEIQKVERPGLRLDASSKRRDR